jgi:hypothetical protein
VLVAREIQGSLLVVDQIEAPLKPAAIGFLFPFSVVSLKHELQAAKAKITIFLTGDFARDEILYPALGNDDWRNNVAEENKIAVKCNSEFGPLLWGYHPRSAHGMTHLRELEGFVAGFAASRLICRSSR